MSVGKTTQTINVNRIKQCVFVTSAKRKDNTISTVQVSKLSFSDSCCKEKDENFNDNSNFFIYIETDEHFSNKRKENEFSNRYQCRMFINIKGNVR